MPQTNITLDLTPEAIMWPREQPPKVTLNTADAIALKQQIEKKLAEVE